MPEWRSQGGGEAVADEFCRFVARQPILDRNRWTFGYELLFRTGWENRFNAEGESASRHMIDNAVAFGMESLVGDRLPFVNCTRSLLLNGLATLLPRNTIIEILEDVVVDDALVLACKRMRAIGYRFALDDYDFSDNWRPLLPVVDFIKVDFRQSTTKVRQGLLRRFRYSHLQFIAEKIEDDTEFRLALDEGFHYFQGYFVTKPVVLSRPALSSVVNRFRFLAELGKPGFNIANILRLLKEEPSISYRLLRLANSAAMGLRSRMTNLRTALAMVGEEQFKKMALTALAGELCGEQPQEMLRIILQKARFCELMGPEMGMEPAELYLLGMLSAVRYSLQLEAGEIFHGLRLRPDMIAALNGASNSYGHLLRLSETYEAGEWAAFSAAAGLIGRKEQAVSAKCLAAQRWAEQVLAAS